LAVVASSSALADPPALETVIHGPTRDEKAPKPKLGDGFEKTKWRMSVAQVMALYPDAKPSEGGLSVNETVMGRPALVALYFSDDFGLSRVLVLFKESLDGVPAALQVFDELEAATSKKLGLPTQSTEWWTVKPSRMTEAAREQSIASGGLKIASTWAGAHTWLMLSIGTTAAQDTPGTTMTYVSTGAPLVKDWQKAAMADKKAD
jgi:hypothetical protein